MGRNAIDRVGNSGQHVDLWQLGKRTFLILPAWEGRASVFLRCGLSCSVQRVLTPLNANIRLDSTVKDIGRRPGGRREKAWRFFPFLLCRHLAVSAPRPQYGSALAPTYTHSGNSSLCSLQVSSCVGFLLFSDSWVPTSYLLPGIHSNLCNQFLH